MKELHKQALEWDDPEGNIYHSHPTYYLSGDMKPDALKAVMQAAIQNAARRRQLDTDLSAEMTTDERLRYFTELLKRRPRRPYSWLSLDSGTEPITLPAGANKKLVEDMARQLAANEYTAINPVSPILKMKKSAAYIQGWNDAMS